MTDPAEVRAPADLVGTVESITAAPTIKSGPDRVVLTTVSHNNSDVYELTIKNADGKTETLGVTGSHRFYDETGGWTQTRDLSEGQILRGLSGDLTVLEVVHDPRPERVYNFTVETDHVYYVGDLTALTHNKCERGDPALDVPDSNLKHYTYTSQGGTAYDLLLNAEVVGDTLEVLEAHLMPMDWTKNVSGLGRKGLRHLSDSIKELFGVAIIDIKTEFQGKLVELAHLARGSSSADLEIIICY